MITSVSFGRYLKGIGGPYVNYGDKFENLPHDDISHFFSPTEESVLWNLLDVKTILHQNMIRINYNKVLTSPNLLIMRDSTQTVATSTPPKVLPFPQHGIALSAVDQFITVCGGNDLLKSMTTTDINNEAQKALTYSSKSSYCDQLLAQGESGVGKPIIFVSHAWKYLFLDVMNAIKCHCKGEDAIIWFDLFTNNQHDAPDLDFNWWSTTFKSAIRDIGRTVMVLSPWSDPIPFTRAWCLFEIYCTAETSSLFEVAMSESESRKFIDAAACDIAQFRQMIGTIDVRKSEAWNPLDLSRIFDVIMRTVGFEEINSMVLTRMREWVVECVKGAFDVELAREGVGDGDEESISNLAHTLGLLYNELGLYEQSALSLELAWSRRRKIFGPTGHATLRAANNLAIVLEKQNRFEDALSLLLSCLEAYTDSIGPDHPDTINTCQTLGVVYFKLSRYDEALPLLERHHAYFSSTGNDEMASLPSLMNIGIIYDYTGRSAEALDVFVKALSIQQRVYGQDHPSCLQTSNSIAVVQSNLGMTEESLNTYKTCFCLERTKLGKGHPTTLQTMYNMIKAHEKLRQTDTAEVLYAECLSLMRETFGDFHQATLMCMFTYSQLVLNRGRVQQAMDLIEECCQNASAVASPCTPIPPGYLQFLSICESLMEREKVIRGMAESVLTPHHPHPLTKTDHPYGQGELWVCDVCGVSGRGWAYRCSDCGFDVHVECLPSCAKEESAS
jgi:tetratricopeptide (TPR) repeat protein